MKADPERVKVGILIGRRGFKDQFICLNSLSFHLPGNILQPETIVLNVSGRVLMVQREMNGNASEQLVSDARTEIFHFKMKLSTLSLLSVYHFPFYQLRY